MLFFKKRMERHFDELKWLYIELYGNDEMFEELCDRLYRFYEERNDDLKKIDADREADANWYKKNDMMGMMLYIDNFAGDIKGVESKLDYIERCKCELYPFNAIFGYGRRKVRWWICSKRFQNRKTGSGNDG